MEMFCGWSCTDCGNKGIITGEGEEMEGGDGKKGLIINAGKTKVNVNVNVPK